MRWCLKLNGLMEKTGENVRADTNQLFRKIAPNLEVRQLEDGGKDVARISRSVRRGASASLRFCHWRTGRRGRNGGHRSSRLDVNGNEPTSVGHTNTWRVGKIGEERSGFDTILCEVSKCLLVGIIFLLEG